MPGQILVHDDRLDGSTPRIADKTYTVGSHITTANLVNWVAMDAMRMGRCHRLLILCHGYVSHEDTVSLQSQPHLTGSLGLQLCRENLDLDNVSLTRAWRGKIDNIIVFACRTAGQSRSGDPSYDGTRFCGELALHSGATVYAGEEIQFYDHGTDRRVYHSLLGLPGNDYMDFGGWEGQVFAFNPQHGRPHPVRGPQVSGLTS